MTEKCGARPMLTGRESADELLALWANLLRSRDRLGSAMYAYHIVRYQTAPEGKEHEYYSQSADFDIGQDLQDLFRRDIDCAVDQVEAALREKGVVVTRAA